jgi:hypothetical protein
MNFYLKLMVMFSLILAPQILRAHMGFMERLLFSDKPYAKEMEVNAYIVTQEQACVALTSPSLEIIQLDNQELYQKNTYLLLRVRNTGKKHAWGTLACKVPTYHDPIKISIFGVGRSDRHSYNTYLIQLGSLILTKNEEDTPLIQTEWDKLYTK